MNYISKQNICSNQRYDIINLFLIMEYKLKGHQKVYLVVKRLLDIIFSFIGICFLSWVYIILIILQLIFNPGPVFFVQTRVGRKGKNFKLIKFRSMSQNVNHEMTSDEIGDINNYTNKFGHFLRKFSLDELPQFFNIFVGQMSFLGPRPLIDKGRDSETIKIRRENGSINLRPGLSGLAQISGRVNLDAIKKGEIDGEYYRKFSMLMDIKIIFKTLLKVVRSEDYEKTEEKK